MPCRLRLSHTHTPSWLATTRPGHTPGAQLTAPDKDVSSSSMHGSFAASPLPVVSEPGRLLPIERALFYRPGSVWTTLAAQESDLEEPCRFCFDTAPACELIAPCACVGTQRLVHISCLQQWQRVASLSGSGHKARHSRCRPRGQPRTPSCYLVSLLEARLGCTWACLEVLHWRWVASCGWARLGWTSQRGWWPTAGDVDAFQDRCNAPKECTNCRLCLRCLYVSSRPECRPCARH